MLRYLIPLFIITPVVELYLLIKVGEVIGALPTIALVIVTGIVGAYLAKLEGLRVFSNFQADLLTGKMPKDVLFDGLMILIGGIVLLTPGILTDLFGLSLLFPPTRALYKKYLKQRFQKSGKVRYVETDYQIK